MRLSVGRRKTGDSRPTAEPLEFGPCGDGFSRWRGTALGLLALQIAGDGVVGVKAALWRIRQPVRGGVDDRLRLRSESAEDFEQHGPKRQKAKDAKPNDRRAETAVHRQIERVAAVREIINEAP